MCLFLLAPAAGAVGSPPAFALPNTQVLDIESRASGRDYVLYVSLPRDYAKDPRRQYPVVYTLDADYSFPLVASISGHFSDRGSLPPVIVVGIGYRGGIADMDAYRRNRTRDYTPTHVDSGGYGTDVQALSGGGPAFLDFVTGELFDYVESRYRVDPDRRTLVGHSYGGLFAAYVLLNRPAAFRNYLVVSPSLWYDDKVIMDMEADYAHDHDDLHARACFVVGSFENQPERGRAMVDDLHQLVASLRSRHYPHLEIAEMVFEQETHNSIFPAGVTRGLRILLGEPATQ